MAAHAQQSDEDAMEAILTLTKEQAWMHAFGRKMPEAYYAIRTQIREF